MLRWVGSLLLLCAIHDVNCWSPNGFTTLVDESAALHGSVTSNTNRVQSSGVTVFDCNNDGLDDLFFGEAVGGSQKLFINEGDFTFSQDVGDSNGFGGLSGGESSVAFDYDNDGNVDLAVSSSTFGLKLFRNDGTCNFQDVSDSQLPTNAVWRSMVNTDGIGGALAVGDFDNDGDLDIFQASLGSPNRGMLVESYDTSGRAMLWENMGTHFDVRAGQNGMLPSTVMFACVVSFEDFNEDGWEDLVLSVCTGGSAGRTHMWQSVPVFDGERNTRAFVEVGSQGIGIGPDDVGLPMSQTWGDFNNDGHFEVLMTDMGRTFLNPLLAYPTRLYSPRFRDGCLDHYEEISEAVGIDRDETGWGAAIIDLDNDGWEDIVHQGNYMFIGRTTNPGFVYKNIPGHRGERKFSLQQDLGLTNINSVGLAFADFDNDGNIDLAANTDCVTNSALGGIPFGESICVAPMPKKLFRNSGSDDNTRSHLTVRLRGNAPSSNYFGIGSTITMKIPELGYTKKARIRAGTGWASTDAPFAHFGVSTRNYNGHESGYNNSFGYESGHESGYFFEGHESGHSHHLPKADLIVEWRGSGKHELFRSVSLNQMVILTEGEGKKIGHRDALNGRSRCRYSLPNSMYNRLIFSAFEEYRAANKRVMTDEFFLWK